MRVDSGEHSVVYLPDHVPFHGVADDTLDLIQGVDVLVHDAQYLPGEDELAHAYGHATTDEAIELAVRCGVGALVMTHHAPARTDAALDALAAQVRSAPLPVIVARQGLVLDTADPGCTRE